MKKITLVLFFLIGCFGYSQAPTVDPTTPPVRNAEDVISIFSEAYANISGADYNPNWAQSGFGVANTAYDTGSGNLVLAYTSFNYQGVDFNGVQDVSGMEFLHLDIWTDGGVAPNVYVISSGAEIAHVIPNAVGSWQSIDIPISGITGNPAGAIQFKFDGGNASTHAIYVDNLYFWKTPTAVGSDATLSDLQVDSATISGFSPSVIDYNIDLPNGTTVVPQITVATATDTNATSVTITQASSLSGNATVVVVSQNGLVTKTYTISFVLSGPGIAAPTPPNRNAEDVISIYSDAYTDINVDTYDTPWCPGISVDVMIAGNTTKKVTGLGCEGIDFQSGRFDASTFTHFHIDVWTDTAVLDKSFNLKFSQWGGGAGEVSALEFSATNASDPALDTQGAWMSLDMPLTSWTGSTRDDLVQFIITSDLGVVFYDNLYLYKGEALGVNDVLASSFSTYPNPTQDSWTIKTSTEEITSVQVFDVLGKRVLALTPNTSEVTIDGSSLKRGLYFAQIKTINGSISVKLVKK